jgi:anti-sigma B factor antagonist
MWTAPTLRECLFTLSEQGRPRAVVDLEAVEFLDSTALGVLVGAHKRFVQGGGGLVLVCTTARILRVLEVTGLARVFTVHDSVDAAVAAA